MAADITTIIGQTRFLQLVDETTWGSVPDSPTWNDIPITSYNVRFHPKRRNGQARIGKYQKKFGTNVSGHPTGQLVTALHGYHAGAMATSLAEYLMSWGFLDQEVKYPRSKAAQYEYAAHEDDKGHTGLRVNQATLAGSESGIVLTLDLVGKTATNFTGTATAPDTRHKLVEFLFEDSVFKMDTVALPISSFTWTVQRNLTPLYENSASPIACPKISWSETFAVTPVKSDSTWDAARDALGMAEHVGQLTLKGLHDGTGTALTNWTQVVIDFARMSLIDADENGDPGIIMTPLTFDVLKPDTSANGSVMTWSDIA